MTRKISISVTDDEYACLTATAKQHRVRVSAFVRDQALFAAGWDRYGGPLFVPTEQGADRDRSDAAVAHSVLRHVVELTRHIRQRFACHEPPRADTSRMLISYLGVLAKHEPPLIALRRIDGVSELVERLWMNGRAIVDSHALLGNTIVEAAEKIQGVLRPSAAAHEKEKTGP